MNVIFLIYPYHTNLQRAIKKAPKVKSDIGYLEDEGSRYENFLALELMSAITRHNDFEGTELKISFIRNTSGQEVDFAVHDRKQLHCLYEAKNTKNTIDKNLIYFTDRLGVPGAQVLLSPHREQSRGQIELLGIHTAVCRWLPKT